MLRTGVLNVSRLSLGLTDEVSQLRFVDSAYSDIYDQFHQLSEEYENRVNYLDDAFLPLRSAEHSFWGRIERPSLRDCVGFLQAVRYMNHMTNCFRVLRLSGNGRSRKRVFSS